MGKYMIVREGSKWYVKKGWSIEFVGETKQECLDWISTYG